MQTPSTPPPEGAGNLRTVQAYERYARTYAQVVSPEPSDQGKEALRRLTGHVGAGGAVLEIGSGPGWDADHLELLGVEVRRTDVTAAFRDLQAERGREVAPLDLIRDPLGGPYDGVVALYVLQHIERELTASVLAKVADALRPAGAFLLSIREGVGDIWEQGASGDYLVVERTLDEFAAALSEAGLEIEWSEPCVESNEAWLIILARKRP